MRMDVVASSSGSFKVSARKRKMGQVDVDDDSDGELKDLEVIWNKGFVDNDIEDEQLSQQTGKREVKEDGFYCVTPDRPNQLTRFQRQKVASFTLNKEHSIDEMCFYQFCVNNEDQKVVDVYKVTQQPPSLKVLKKHRSRKPFVKKRKTLFKDLFVKDFVI